MAQNHFSFKRAYDCLSRMSNVDWDYTRSYQGLCEDGSEC